MWLFKSPLTFSLVLSLTSTLCVLVGYFTTLQITKSQRMSFQNLPHQLRRSALMSLVLIFNKEKRKGLVVHGNMHQLNFLQLTWGLLSSNSHQYHTTYSFLDSQPKGFHFSFLKHNVLGEEHVPGSNTRVNSGINWHLFFNKLQHNGFLFCEVVRHWVITFSIQEWSWADLHPGKGMYFSSDHKLFFQTYIPGAFIPPHPQRNSSSMYLPTFNRCTHRIFLKAILFCFSKVQSKVRHKYVII